MTQVRIEPHSSRFMFFLFQQVVAPPPEASAAGSDACLHPFLRATTDLQERHALDGLMREIEPLLRGIVRRRWITGSVRGAGLGSDAQTAEDVVGEIRLNLLRRLNRLKEDPAQQAIRSWEGFVSRTAHHVCDNWVRRKYPQRHSLKTRLVDLLSGGTAQQGFALWSGGPGERLCGFAQWRTEGRKLQLSERYRRLLDRPANVAIEILPREDPQRMNPGALLAALFNWVGGPLELDDLVAVMAQLWAIRDLELATPRADDEQREDPVNAVLDRGAGVAAEVEQRAYLQRLWTEIGELPVRQRLALLLNLKDAENRGVVALFVIRGVATLRQIAAALEMTPERFAALWNDLPLDDLRIADLLGATRQQVINLRKVARERLARRMRAFEGEAA